MAKSIPFYQIPVGSLMRQGTKLYRKIDDEYFVSYTNGKDGDMEIRANFTVSFIPVTDEWLQSREKQKKNQSAARNA